MSDVDFILNNWFGEPPEHSDNERALIRHLYEPLREIERQRDLLVRVLKDCEIALRTVAKDDEDFHLARHQVREVRAALKAVEE